MIEQIIPGSERRQHERRTLRTAASVLLPNNMMVEGRLLDISVGGLCVVIDANPRPGQNLVIRFNMPKIPSGITVYDVTTQVAYSVFSNNDGGFKVGVRFLNTPPGLMQAINAYIADGLRSL